MTTGKARGAVALVSFFFLGLALEMAPPKAREGAFNSDEATYYMMAQSLAHDADIAYEREDLVRVLGDFPAGPTGLFLKRSPRKPGVVSFAKGYLYPALAAPFVRVFGARGFHVLHAIFLFAVLRLGTGFLARRGRGGASPLAFTVTFVFASVAFNYYFWFTPEFLNFTLVFCATALWMEGCAGKASDPPRPGGRLASITGARAPDLAAAFLYGLATFLKPLFSAVLVVPLGISYLARRRVRGAFTLGIVFTATVALLFEVNILATGDWNFQAGDRKTFYGPYPFESPGATFETTGIPMVGKVDAAETADADAFVRGMSRFFTGRFTGLVPYFFPAVLCLWFFLTARRDLVRWLLLGAALVQIACFVIAWPFNYVGGGGVLGNRYFMGVYPLFFFLAPESVGAGGLVLAWAVAGLFVSQVLVNPVASAHAPAQQAKVRFPFGWLPVEENLLLDLPTNTNPHAFNRPFGRPPRYSLFYLDDNFHGREQGCDWVPFGDDAAAGCYWIRGAARSEALLAVDRPARAVYINLRNGPGPERNRARAWVDGERQEADLAPGEIRRLRWEVGAGVPYHYKGVNVSIHRIGVESERGFLPFFLGESGDRRYLGLFVNIAVEPAPGNGPRPEASLARAPAAPGAPAADSAPSAEPGAEVGSEEDGGSP